MAWEEINSAPTKDECQELLMWDGHSYHICYLGWWDCGKPVWFNGDVVVEPTHWTLPPPPPAPSLSPRPDID